MSKENTTHGFGLAITGLALLAGAFFVTFYLNQCIFGSIIAVISAVLSTSGFIEARRAGGPRKFTLSILIIAWLGAVFSIIWTVSGSSRAPSIIVPAEEEVIQEEEKVDKEKKLEELEKKMEELEGKEE